MGDVVPSIAGTTYTWVFSPADVGTPLSLAAVFNASGYAPDSYCGPGDTCVVSGPPIPYE